MDLIPQEVQSFDYYKNKLPLYLQQSYGFLEHYKIWYDLLIGSDDKTGILGTSETLLNLLNIFDDNYLNYINSLPGNDGGTVSDILDKIGSIFGVTRNFSVQLPTYKFKNTIGSSTFEAGDRFDVNFVTNNQFGVYSQIGFIDVGGTLYLSYWGDGREDVYNFSNNTWSSNTYKTIALKSGNDYDNQQFRTWLEANADLTDPMSEDLYTLNNKEFLLLIKCRIIQNNFDGTYETLRKFYEDIGLNIFTITTNTCEATSYLIENSSNISNNILAMFRTGMLQVKSMGINYKYIFVEENS